MKKTSLLMTVLGIITLSAVILGACKKEKDNSSTTPAAGKAKVNFHLTDAPADYDAVYIDIQQVEVTVEGSAAVTLTPVRPGVYNLLDFRNGLDTLLLRAELPPGKVGQMRLILGTENSVVVNGTTYALTTPSAQQSGLKLNLQQEFVANGSYDVWIDFDAGKSIVETGNGKYMLKPVIRAYTSLTDGRIRGYVQPISALVTVYVSNGVDTYTAIPRGDGFFLLAGLPEGNYTVTFDAGLIAFTDVTLNNINVTYGQTTELGTTVLTQ